MILSTRFRDIPKPGEAYPLNNESLLEALEGLPLSEIEVSYSTYRMSERRYQKTKMSKANRSYQNYANSIIRAHHERKEPKMQSSEGASNDIWSISIHSLPTDQLTAFRERMDSEGYSHLRNWFIDIDKKQGAMATDSLIIGFDGKNLSFRQFSKF